VTLQFIDVETFEQWRVHARRLLETEVSPAEVQWNVASDQMSLFGESEVDSRDAKTDASPTPATSNATTGKQPRVPKAFIDLAETIACHRDPCRWTLLYQTLWRLTHGERNLLDVITDEDVHQLHQMRKSITRDMHKMKAFVRFRKTIDESGEEMFIAWHRPDHRIVRQVSPFFSRRFRGMNWSILTPDESVVWDQKKLQYGPGVPASQAPADDELEDLWRTYYASIFNPARVKVATMKREMPVRHWATLPEATIIDDLLREAPARVDAMIETSEGFAQTAAAFMPSQRDVESLRIAASKCQACSLHCAATQTVFGIGPVTARVMIVGEQPGDQEDLAGQPFIGPAGGVLDQALQTVGIRRDEIYLTNVVKHFKFVESTSGERGKRRLHQKPNSREISACRPWLEAEIQSIQPDVIVCLGATAASALLGRDFRITKQRGRILKSEWCERTVATWHPAAILRMIDPGRKREMSEQLAADLRLAKS